MSHTIPCIVRACAYRERPSFLPEKHEELKATTQRLEEQRDQTLTDFESLEKAFADLHQRYLKLKTASQTLHKVRVGKTLRNHDKHQQLPSDSQTTIVATSQCMCVPLHTRMRST